MTHIEAVNGPLPVDTSDATDEVCEDCCCSVRLLQAVPDNRMQCDVRQCDVTVRNWRSGWGLRLSVDITVLFVRSCHVMSCHVRSRQVMSCKARLGSVTKLTR